MQTYVQHKNTFFMLEAPLRKQKPREPPPSQLMKGKILRGFVETFVTFYYVHTYKMYPKYILH